MDKPLVSALSSATLSRSQREVEWVFAPRAVGPSGCAVEPGNLGTPRETEVTVLRSAVAKLAAPLLHRQKGPAWSI